MALLVFKTKRKTVLVLLVFGFGTRVKPALVLVLLVLKTKTKTKLVLVLVVLVLTHVDLFLVLVVKPNKTKIVVFVPQIDRWWLLFFPNDLRCGFRKLKERGVGNRTSGAVLVPKSLLVLLLLPGHES